MKQTITTQTITYFSFVLLLLGVFSCSSTDDSVNEEVMQDMELIEPVDDFEELPAGEGLPIGITAPTFELPDGYGETHNLQDYIGTKKVVVVFYRFGG